MSALTSPCRPDDAGAAAVTVERLAALIETGAALTLLDVREPWERDICALPDSLAIPLAHLPALVETLPHDNPVVVICHHGIRSAHATAWLRQAGFANAVNLAGGLDAWALRIDPKMRRY
ncbi:MAG: sulfurtransferase [Alphaproteobacteria bacterium]|jgi:rhodanese-related sulfurtransferase|nr:sulfurtransferase [Alphaproteobacteria bacterium]